MITDTQNGRLTLIEEKTPLTSFVWQSPNVSHDVKMVTVDNQDSSAAMDTLAPKDNLDSKFLFCNISHLSSRNGYF